MTTGSWLFLGLIMLAILAYLRLSLRLSAIILVVATALATAFLPVPISVLLLGWLVSAALIALTFRGAAMAFRQGDTPVNQW